MIKAICYDLDGTLVDTLPGYLKSYDSVLRKFEIYLPTTEVVKYCFGKTEENICKSLQIENKTEEFRNLYFEAVKKYNVKKNNLFDGVIETLKNNKKNKYHLGLISFAYRWYVDEMVKRLGILKYFDVIIGFDDVKKAKPDSESIFLAGKRLKVSPSEILMIGDSGSDIVMGNGAGSNTVLFNPDSYDVFYNLEMLKNTKPKYIVKNYSELDHLLEGL
jgi:HAD superfamily hydrolase (TIGR01549 family)